MPAAKRTKAAARPTPVKRKTTRGPIKVESEKCPDSGNFRKHDNGVDGVAPDQPVFLFKQESGSNQQSLRTWSANNPGMCCVCMKEGTQKDLLTCESIECAVTVHPACYVKCRADRGAWKCQKCMSADPSLVRCVLCPARDGALEPVKDSDVWIHTICRQWIVSQRDNDRPITEKDLQRLDAKSWQKLCSLCTSEERQTQGCKLLCNAAGCKNNMHPTCAADLGLLEKDTIHPDMSDPYFIYCKQHGSDDPRLNSWAKWVRNKQRILDQAAAKARTLASPEHLLDPRAVMTTYFAEFDEKQCEAITKMDHDIVQAGAEEAAYNRSITKLRREIATLTRSREEEEKAHQAVESETEELQKRLLAVFACLQRPSGLVDEIPQKNTIDLFFKAGANAGFKPEYEAAFLEAYARALAQAEPLTIQIPAQNGRRGNSTMVGNSIMGGSSVGLCGICKTFEGNATLLNGTTPSPTSEVPPNRNNNNARRLVLCTTCLRSFHMGCLDPPLKSKPPRGYAWRCEGCDTSPEPSTASSASSPDKKRKRERWDDGSPTGTSDTAGSAESDSARPKRIRTMPSRYAF